MGFRNNPDTKNEKNGVVLENAISINHFEHRVKQPAKYMLFRFMRMGMFCLLAKKLFRCVRTILLAKMT